MKKYLLSFLFSLIAFSSLLHAQKQQPQWEMPFYFEDADGVKDTVWVGYDPEASIFGTDVDTLFEEDSIEIDTSEFQTFLFGFPKIINKVRKRSIISIISNGYELPVIIKFNKGKLPLKITWHDSLLNSDSLPFPDISPMHRAKVWIPNSLGIAKPDPAILCCTHCSFVITGDTGYLQGIEECPVPGDSMVLSTPDNNYYTAEKGIGSIQLYVVPSDKPLNIGIKEETAGLVRFSPNPFQNRLLLFKTSKLSLELTLYDSRLQTIAKTIMQPEESSKEWMLNELTPGLYFLEERSEIGSTMHRIIKSS